MKEKIKKINWMKGLPAFSLQEISKVDWIVMLAAMAFLFVAFVEGDIIVTGNRSFLYYKGFLDDFYKASYEQSQGFYANYLPSTFLAFAIWNLPLYLLGRIPAGILQDSFINLMWYKLLPVILYFVTSHLLYKIAMEIGFEEKKAKFCKFAFLVCPIGIYSQFIFSQYDIFMIFFLVLGVYYYFKDGLFRFALFFGIAATFKYQALAYFAVLLVLREKRFRHLAVYVATALAPLAAAILPYIHSPYFYRCVLGFHALSFVDGGFQVGFISKLSLILAVGAYLMVWAYVKRISGREEFVSWAIFLCNGVSFAIFGFSRWNPQWFLVIVPFLVLGVMMNRHGKMMILIMNIFIVALYIFSVNQWAGIADQIMLKAGIFKFILGDRPFAVTMADVYGYDNMANLGTCIFIIILVYFIFNHPKYHSLRQTEVQPYMINYLRTAFLVGVLAFVIPAGVCMVHAMRGEVIFTDTTETEVADCGTVNITDTAQILQTFTADGDYLTDIRIRVGMHNRINDSTIEVTVRDSVTQEVIYQGQVDTLSMVKEESMYPIVKGKIPVEPGRDYELILKGSDGPDNCVAAYYREAGDDEEETAAIGGVYGKQQLIMEVRGIDSRQ